MNVCLFGRRYGTVPSVLSTYSCMSAQLSNGATSLVFGMDLRLIPNIVYASSKCADVQANLGVRWSQ